MQDPNGDATCNENHNVQNPCAKGTIEQMICDGTVGTRDSGGLAQWLNQANRGDVSTFYCAARMYNSGDVTGDLDSYGTRCYATDITDRLTGWVDAPSKCHLEAKFLNN